MLAQERTSQTIRQFVLALLIAVALVAGTGVASRTAAQEATPASSLAIELTSGIVPTLYGEVALPEKVERIITITDGSLDAMIALGITPVGATVSSSGEPAQYLGDRVPDAVVYVGGWAEVDGELDVEKMIELNPDVILADRYLAEADYAIFSKVAPVIASGEIEVVGPESLQQWEYELLIWGHAVGKDAESLALIEGVRTRAAGIKAKFGDGGGGSVVVFRPQPDFPVIMSHRWITGTVLTWAGFTGNALTAEMDPPHSGRDYSLEQLDLLEADWIFAAARNDEHREALGVYEGYPLFQQLTAFKEGRVAVVDGALWSGATGVLAAHAMLDAIEEIIFGGSPEAAPGS